MNDKDELGVLECNSRVTADWESPDHAFLTIACFLGKTVAAAGSRFARVCHLCVYIQSELPDMTGSVYLIHASRLYWGSTYRDSGL